MDAIFRVRCKWLLTNMLPLLWVDVKYHVPTVLLRHYVLWGAIDEGFYVGDEDIHQAHACLVACPADVWGDVAARLCQQWVGG